MKASPKVLKGVCIVALIGVGLFAANEMYYKHRIHEVAYDHLVNNPSMCGTYAMQYKIGNWQMTLLEQERDIREFAKTHTKSDVKKLRDIYAEINEICLGDIK